MQHGRVGEVAATVGQTPARASNAKRSECIRMKKACHKKKQASGSVGKKLSIMSERVRNTVTLFFRPQSA
jgi:hypothetical protein